MNPMTNMKNVKKLSEQELHRSSKSSWHDQYRDSAWIFVGGLPYDLTEGDIICVFSQYGEIVNINLVRDKSTGKQKGFCFVCYEDQRSTVLAVDNLNGIKILNRTIRVDHVNDYKMPNQKKEVDAETKKIYDEGCGPGVKHEQKPEPLPIPTKELPAFARENEPPPDGFRLPPRLPIGAVKLEKLDDDDDEELSTKVKIKKEKKHKKDKKRKKSKKKHRKQVSSSESSSSSESDTEDDVQTKITNTIKTNSNADESAKKVDIKPMQENSRYGKPINKLPDSSRDKYARQRDDKYRRYDERKRTYDDDRRDRDDTKRHR